VGILQRIGRVLPGAALIVCFNLESRHKRVASTPDPVKTFAALSQGLVTPRLGGSEQVLPVVEQTW